MLFYPNRRLIGCSVRGATNRETVKIIAIGNVIFLMIIFENTKVDNDNARKKGLLHKNQSRIVSYY